MIIPRFIRRWFRPPYDGLRHFGVVEEGALYRCGQPTAEQLRELIQKLSLRTVVSLRGARDERDAAGGWETDERRICKELGVDFVTLPCNHKNPPTAEQIETFLQLMRDAARRPALVHCRIGQQRTGMFCALYRVHIQGVDAESALQEMDELGFNIRHRRHQQLLESYRRFAKRGALPSGVG